MPRCLVLTTFATVAHCEFHSLPLLDPMHAAGHWRYYGTHHRERHLVVYGIDCPSFEAHCNAYRIMLVKYGEMVYHTSCLVFIPS
jgi:hypothetical protein